MSINNALGYGKLELFINRYSELNKFFSSLCAETIMTLAFYLLVLCTTLGEGS